jgi:hypothetical protein
VPDVTEKLMQLLFGIINPVCATSQFFFAEEEDVAASVLVIVNRVINKLEKSFIL